jgi:hypothetical protein
MCTCSEDWKLFKNLLCGLELKRIKKLFWIKKIFEGLN